MFSAPWVCTRCLSRSLRLTQRKTFRPQWRFHSTAKHALLEALLSPVLLNRARAIATEYESLSTKLAESFDTKTAKRAGELASAATAVKEWDKANEAISELNGLLKDPSTDSELRELASDDLTSTTESLPILSTKVKHALIPKHPFADLPCLVEIRPGAGGDEAGIFAFELMKMYQAFCARRGLRSNMLKKETDAAGSGGEDRLTEAVMEIETQGSYATFRPEAGVHRVQRVPATEGKGRTHTSAVSVVILPNMPDTSEGDSELNFDDPNSDYYIDPKEVQVEKMRASGAGGQHVNKTESAIRLTHSPTGITVSMQESRSQPENRRRAWQLLRARIAQARREIREEEMVKLRRGAMGGVGKMGRGDKIRTYNFGQSRCTDHRSGLTIHNLVGVMEGGDGLDKIMESVDKWLIDQDVEALYLDEQAKGASGSNKGMKGKKS
ncbi:hypothetical protein AJ80_05311 [Polytolypa hystricis UAMH7299]|uniref:Prokaryotic-type class I peptide chain release factors domain-containing protein n=1 Tax=Polytolypa hystricis (strain UAMH7299) TaxID=1447883 RepID=A0A2B7Y3M7_POLH7|nr:hypothetical protein AJ80_05311 [Polytolypa hystricis UAMH7299]